MRHFKVLFQGRGIHYTIQRKKNYLSLTDQLSNYSGGLWEWQPSTK